MSIIIRSQPTYGVQAVEIKEALLSSAEEIQAHIRLLAAIGAKIFGDVLEADTVQAERKLEKPFPPAVAENIECYDRIDRLSGKPQGFTYQLSLISGDFIVADSKLTPLGTISVASRNPQIILNDDGMRLWGERGGAGHGDKVVAIVLRR
jgi:hypothetical protein